MAIARRNFLAGAAAAAAALGARPARPQPPARPNILLLLADDLRFDALGAFGGAPVQTPHIDALAARGCAFTHTYCAGAEHGALCVPSRAMLMTGRGLFDLVQRGNVIPPEHRMLPETLRQAGYRCFAAGKWHNDRASLARGFDEGAQVFLGGMLDQLNPPLRDFDPTGRFPGTKVRIERRPASELIAEATIDFLARHGGAKPFFAYAAFTAPHDPRSSPPPYDTMYDPAQMPLPPSFMPEHPFDNGELRVRDELLAPHPRTPETVQRHIADYYGIISHLDAQVGRILDALDAAGQAGNTIVVFVSDNGLAVGRHGLMGKQSLYDHSIRVPMILAGPGLPQGARNPGLCMLHDLNPALCDLAGVAPPGGMHARSFAAALRGAGPAPRDRVFAAYRNQQRMIRHGAHKLIRYRAGGQPHTQLFDLDADPWELRNLADAHADRAAELGAMLAQAMREAGDPCDTAAADWGCPETQG